MNYYLVKDAKTKKVIAEGTARECRKALGCSSLDSFYALVSRARNGTNKKYEVEMFHGGNVCYPVVENALEDLEQYLYLFDEHFRQFDPYMCVLDLIGMERIFTKEEKYLDSIKALMIAEYFALNGAYCKPEVPDLLVQRISGIKAWITEDTILRMFESTVDDYTVPFPLISTENAKEIFLTCLSGNKEDVDEKVRIARKNS